jgi:glycosyltransferase involved in cell wall biosynthesis
MKIVSLGLYNPIPINTGSDSYAYYLLNSISKDNEILHYYFTKLKSSQGRFPDKINFQTKYLESNFSKKILKKKIPRIFQYPRLDLFLDKSDIDKIKADIIICDIVTYFIARYISKKNNCPLILVEHDIEWKKLKSDNSLFYLPMMIYEKFIFKKVNAITTISMSDYQYVTKFIDKNNVFYIPPVFDSVIYNPKGISYEFSRDKLNVLFYGSLDRPMNIQALNFIKNSLIPLLKKERLLEKVRINIFGSGSPPKYIKLEKDKNIDYLGIVENPGMYIRGADLVIVPVKNVGGTKVRVLETLFCGKPIIITPELATGLPDEFKKYVFIEKDAKGFLKLIKQFLEKPPVSQINTEIIENYIKKCTTMQNVVENVLSVKK